jgi:deferrochelatase/peroxidase EfeB
VSRSSDARGPARRSFLRSAAALAAGASTLSVVGSAMAASSTDSGADGELGNWSFEGGHQAGILTPIQEHSCFVSLDVTAENRAELVELMRTITERARFLTAGGGPAAPGIGSAPDGHPRRRRLAVRRTLRSGRSTAEQVGPDADLPERQPAAAVLPR